MIFFFIFGDNNKQTKQQYDRYIDLKESVHLHNDMQARLIFGESRLGLDRPCYLGDKTVYSVYSVWPRRWSWMFAQCFSQTWKNFPKDASYAICAS